MSDYFVSVTKHKGQAVVQIEHTVESQNGSTQRYPLTKRGCILAGKWLYHIHAKAWMSSSSVDFPKEVKPTFRHNVSDLMLEGYNSLAVQPIVQERRVADYEIRGNQFIAIAINVNDPKDAHYFDIDPDVNNDAFIRACGWAYEPN